MNQLDWTQITVWLFNAFDRPFIVVESFNFADLSKIDEIDDK